MGNQNDIAVLQYNLQKKFPLPAEIIVGGSRQQIHLIISQGSDSQFSGQDQFNQKPASYHFKL